MAAKPKKTLSKEVWFSIEAGETALEAVVSYLEDGRTSWMAGGRELPVQRAGRKPLVIRSCSVFLV